MGRAGRVTLLTTMAAASSSCSVVVGEQPLQCREDTECAVVGDGLRCVEGACTAQAPSGPDFDCVGNPRVGTEPGPFPFQETIADIVTGEVPDGLTVQVCGKLDVECSSPLERLDASDGTLELELQAGFEGVIDFRAPGMLPGRLQLPRPVDEHTRLGSFPLLVLDNLAPVLSLADVELDEGAAHLGMRVVDCQGRFAAGVRIDSGARNPDTVEIYLDDGAPSPALEETAADAEAVLFNLTPGFSTVTMTRAADGLLLAEYSVSFRAGEITYLTLGPP